MNRSGWQRAAWFKISSSTAVRVGLLHWMAREMVCEAALPSQKPADLTFSIDKSQCPSTPLECTEESSVKMEFRRWPFFLTKNWSETGWACGGGDVPSSRVLGPHPSSYVFWSRARVDTLLYTRRPENIVCLIIIGLRKRRNRSG